MGREVKKLCKPQATENLELLMNEMMLSICMIAISDDVNDVLSRLHDYENSCFYKENNPCEYSGQVGRVWLLVGMNGNEATAITVGQSLDIIDEIQKIICGMFNSKDNREKIMFYKSLLSEFKYIEFYEVPVDTYIKSEYGNYETGSGIARVMFDLSKEYLVEASIAFKTGARDWNFYNSGMDKRSHIFIKDNEIKKYSMIEKKEREGMSKNKFEIHNDMIMIARPEWDFVATATVRDDYAEEMQRVTWGLNNNRYPHNASLGTLHSYIMRKWYGDELCDEMKKNDFVIDHMDNVSHNCCINNLWFLSNAWNKSKGLTLDKESADKRYIALNMSKDFETGLFQITIQFNYPAKLKLEGFEKPSIILLAYLLYEGDYKSVILDAEEIINDYLEKYEFNPEKLRAIDYHIEGEVGLPIPIEIYDEYLRGKHGHGVCFFDKRAPLKGWTSNTDEKFFVICDHEGQKYIKVTM